MIRSSPLALAAAVAALTLSLTVDAGADVKRSVKTADGYLDVFDDDPLGASAEAATGWRIVVRQPTARAQLIRPRTSFVVELIKTVEQIGP